MDWEAYKGLNEAEKERVRARERNLQRRADLFNTRSAIALTSLIIVEAWALWAFFTAALQDASSAVVLGFTAAGVATCIVTAFGGLAYVAASGVQRTQLTYPEEAD